jgi:hypothetical protein
MTENEEQFILTQSFGGFSSRSVGPTTLGCGGTVHIMWEHKAEDAIYFMVECKK